MDRKLDSTLDVTRDTSLKSDVVIGEDSTDYSTVNSETKFLNDVNIGGSSIKLRSFDNTSDHNLLKSKEKDYIAHMLVCFPPLPAHVPFSVLMVRAVVRTVVPPSIVGSAWVS